jgi:Tfp pilus assembly protein PilV
VVLFVVSLGLIGVLSLIIQNIQGQNLNKNNIVAYQLAQEGVELVRKVRDTNWNTGAVAWNYNLAVGTYYMDYADELPHPLSDLTQGILYKDNEGLYVHESGASQSTFNRIIIITSNNSHSMSVLARVTWMDHNKNYTYDLETALFNWR